MIVAAGLCVLSSCERETVVSDGSDVLAEGTVRLLLTADVTTGTVPLTVSFTGTLYGAIDTLLLRVPEVSFDGGNNPNPDVYLANPDTLAPPRRLYTSREHYLQSRTFRAVMTLHGRFRDITSDTLLITVQ